MGRLEHVGNDGSNAPMLPDVASGQQIADALIDENEPRSVVDSVDTTDGVGSIRFSDEENAGFFGSDARPTCQTTRFHPICLSCV